MRGSGEGEGEEKGRERGRVRVRGGGGEKREEEKDTETVRSLKFTSTWTARSFRPHLCTTVSKVTCFVVPDTFIFCSVSLSVRK